MELRNYCKVTIATVLVQLLRTGGSVSCSSLPAKMLARLHIQPLVMPFQFDQKFFYYYYHHGGGAGPSHQCNKDEMKLTKLSPPPDRTGFSSAQ